VQKQLTRMLVAAVSERHTVCSWRHCFGAFAAVDAMLARMLFFLISTDVAVAKTFRFGESWEKPRTSCLEHQGTEPREKRASVFWECKREQRICDMETKGSGRNNGGIQVLTQTRDCSARPI